MNITIQKPNCKANCKSPYFLECTKSHDQETNERTKKQKKMVKQWMQKIASDLCNSKTQLQGWLQIILFLIVHQESWLRNQQGNHN
jgi:hypothetical protein